MALYSALHPTVEAIQWFKNGDHPHDHVINNINSGRVVGRHSTYAANNFTSCMVCPKCGKAISTHGVLNKVLTGDKNIQVCPGDYIEYIRDHKDRVIAYKLLKQEEFEKYYTLQAKGEI